VTNSTTLIRVKALLTAEGQPRPILLLGAGASVMSGIPSADDLADQIARHGYCLAHNLTFGDPSVERSDWVQWLGVLPWYEDGLSLERRYPLFVEKLLQPREERKRFFQQAIRVRSTQPSRGYFELAELVGKGWIRTILTTNFDDLVYEACRGNFDAASITAIKTPDQAHLISSDPVDPQVINLHGSIEYYTDCNLQEETEGLAPTYVAALAPLLRDHPLVVIGYRGAERSVMHDLLIAGAAAAGGYRHGIFWCVREPGATLHDHVTDLAESIGHNFFLVPIEGFDEAMVELNDGVDRSARAPATPTPTHPSVPDLALSAVDLDDLDWELIERRLPLVAGRLAMDVPAVVSRGWLTNTLVRLRLAVREAGALHPTRAGELLFSARRPARVEFVRGHRRQMLAGNLCELLQQTTDLLTEVNAPFRLKGPVSEDVRPYPQLALKELLVNALVHHDHSLSELVRVHARESQVVFVSPGSVVPTVDVTQLGKAGVKGYRNPLLAGFFYGTGDMDKKGSGLVDVRRWSQEIGGDATFETSDQPAWFRAVLTGRPERPDPVRQVAEPAEGYEVFYANALRVRLPRGVIDIGACPASTRQEIFERHPGEQTAPFALQGGELLTLSDLADLANPLRAELSGTPKQLDLEEFCADPDDERVVVGLLNETLRRHTRSLGLRILDRDQRLYFPRTEEGERKTAYHGRVRDARRTVVKARVSSATGQVSYWEHHAVRWRFRRFGPDWYLLLLPGWVFTKDGEDQLLGGERITSLSTRRAAKEYNTQVSSHVFFWAAVLVGEESAQTLADGSGVVALERSPLTTHVVGAPPARGVDQDSEEDDLELQGLDIELAELARSAIDGEALQASDADAEGQR
jgi:hypothetical protein